MKGLLNIKVTVEDAETGETITIRPGGDGKVVCETDKGKVKVERAANASPRGETKTRPAKAPPRPGKDAADGEADKAEADKADKTEGSKRKKTTTRKAGGEKPTPARRRRTSLKWSPVKDHDYHGFAAPASHGQYKVLKTKGSQWALFLEQKDSMPKHIGCFRKEDKAKERAQELHDGGWPESEFGPVTAGQVARACPMPSGEEDDEDPPAAPATAKPAEEKPAAAPSATGDEPSIEAKDQELRSSFTGEVDQALDEEDD